MKLPLLFGATLFALSHASASHAENANLKTIPLAGPYIGVYGGYDWVNADAAGTRFEPDGWDGGVFAGYKMDAFLGGITEKVGLGGNAALEVFYGGGNGDDRVDGVTVEKDQEWGVSFRPGISILDKATGDLGLNPYGIIGYRNTEFEASNGVSKSSDNYHGFELGIGTELVAYGDVGIRVDYSHTWYDAENGIDPDSDGIRMGASYHF